ncbi:MAG: 4-hydroxy-tetrahydrodipicolinate synthase [Oscillospiraceae bacterium]|nr:4-hydroxy-tetrahydrodipicolinate synthase [Oscillospiraceae bacterium]
MKNTIFTGAAVALVTPFAADGSVDYDVLARLIDDQIENGTDALVITGTTGESSTLTEEEHIEVIAFSVKHTAKRVPVIAGTGSNDTACCIRLSKAAKEVGADALLLVTPYYNKTTQRGLVAHYTLVADSVDLPIILYNVPSRTGVGFSLDTIDTLANHKNIVAIKEASGNISFSAQVIERCADRIDVYSGNDDQIVPMMSLGAKGVISVLSNVIPQETHDMAQAMLDGDLAKAMELQIRYLGLINDLFIEVNPIPVKEAMNLMGMNVGPCRLPLYEMADNNRDALRAELVKHGLVK